MQDGFLTLAKLAEKMAYSKDASDHLRLEVKSVEITLTSTDDNKSASGTWDTPFATFIGAVMGPLCTSTATQMGRNSVYMSAAGATGFTVRAATSGGVAATYTVTVLGIGIGVA